MNTKPTNTDPSDRASRIADLIRASDNRDIYRYVRLLCAAEDVVDEPTPHRLAELDAVLEGIRLVDEQELAMLRRAAASVRKDGQS